MSKTCLHPDKQQAVGSTQSLGQWHRSQELRELVKGFAAGLARALRFAAASRAAAFFAGKTERTHSPNGPSTAAHQ